MKILFEHSGILPVKKYGGTERIIFWLMKELVQRGCEVFLLGHPKSEVSSIGVTLIKKSPELKDWRGLIPKDIDVIHLFYTPPFSLPVPVMVTIEGNGRPGEEFIKNTVFISRKHAVIHGGSHFVYNGLDLTEYPFYSRPKIGWDQFLFLAKASWKVKNLSDCIKAAKASKKHLHIAGGRRLSLSPRIHSYGMVDQEKKIQLFKLSDALLWPVRWHEPFGIAIIEAMAMGLPVIGSTYGSLPELIQEKTGILCSDYQDFERALTLKENPFFPEEIRAFVENHFSSKIMAKNYLDLYEIVKTGEKLQEVKPRYQPKDGPEVLQSF